MQAFIARIIAFIKSLFAYPTSHSDSPPNSPSSSNVTPAPIKPSLPMETHKPQTPSNVTPTPIKPSLSTEIPKPLTPIVNIAPEYGIRTLLTNPERIFFRSLVRAVDGGYAIFAKVRMGDVLFLANEPTDSKQHWTNIQCKHFDFVLCERQFYRPMLVIELDDKSHQKPEAIERDNLKDKICAIANLPVLRIKWTGRALPPDILRDLIDEKLVPTPPEPPADDVPMAE